MYIKLYAFYFYCVYNTIQVSERIRRRTGEFSENGRLGACILCILSYTCFIMIVYIILYIYGLYEARKGVCTRLCILRHTHLYAEGLNCVYKLYTLLISGCGLTYGIWLRSGLIVYNSYTHLFYLLRYCVYELYTFSI